MSGAVNVEACGTQEWASVTEEHPHAGPYHTVWWGELVTRHFGGEFRVVRIHQGKELAYAPLVVGGNLAEDGFCCGHLGYGGVFHADGAETATFVQQMELMTNVAEALGVRCRRFVSFPGIQAADTKAEERITVLTPIPGTAEALWEQMTSNARNTVRRAGRHGLTTRALECGDRDAVVALIHQTQRRVASLYLTPAGLLTDLLGLDNDKCVALGCWLERELIAACIFLVHNRRMAYLFNGWSREHANLSANYLLIHEALERAVAAHYTSMDMGYSHRTSLRKAKLRWGGQEESYYVTGTTG